MQIAEILKPESAIVNIKAKGRKEVIDRLLDVARRVWGLDKKLAVRDIAVHERSYLIRMQAGKYFVAIPHSISQACKQPLLAVATSREGVLWGDAPGEHAHLIFLLLAPPQTHDLYGVRSGFDGGAARRGGRRDQFPAFLRTGCGRGRYGDGGSPGADGTESKFVHKEF